MQVRAFLNGVVREPWRLGWSDCAGAVARWIEAETGRPATILLPPAGNEEETARRLADGGLLACMQRFMEALGLPETSEPMAGDVAHVAVTTGILQGQETAAIYDGRVWLAAMPGRLMPLRRGLGRETIWSVPRGI